MGEGTGIFWKRRLCLSPEKRKALSNICPVGGNRQPRGHPLQMASVCLSGGWGADLESKSPFSALQPAQLHLTRPSVLGCPRVDLVSSSVGLRRSSQLP